MKYWIIPLILIIIFAYLGYTLGSNLILPRCDNLPAEISISECQKSIDQKLSSYQLQGASYGAVIGLILGLSTNFIIKKFRK